MQFLKGISKASIASDFVTLLRIKQGEKKTDAIRNRISDFDKRRISCLWLVFGEAKRKKAGTEHCFIVDNDIIIDVY